MPGGDYDDAVDVIDVWLQENPEGATWERDDSGYSGLLPSETRQGMRFDIEEEPSRFVRF